MTINRLATIYTLLDAQKYDAHDYDIALSYTLNLKLNSSSHSLANARYYQTRAAINSAVTRDLLFLLLSLGA